MEYSGTSTLTNGNGRRRTAPSRQDDTALWTNDDDSDHHLADFDAARHTVESLDPSPTTSSTSEDDSAEDLAVVDTEQYCERRRPEEENHPRLASMSALLIGKTIRPFLREHIPGIYAPVGKVETAATSKQKDPNSKYCYRHRPDSKCRRAADETKMAVIQSELNRLPPADQQAITHVWSLFSAAPSKHRDLMLQGIITQMCFPQLSSVSREVHEQLKIDFITALPLEISYRILSYLDAASLCRAAQVSREWKSLADDDVVWHVICSQHIDRKCTRCGWKLPRLESKRLRDWTKQQELAQSSRQETQEANASRPPTIHPPNTPRSPSPSKRGPGSLDEPSSSKRRRLDANGGDPGINTSRPEQEPKPRPWKDVYRQRHRVGSNWKYGRGSIKIFRGHTNGITALQLLDDKIMATGSYDSTIKIWDLETGSELRTLRGHTRGIRSLQFDDSKLISGSLDHTIKIWNWHTGDCISTLQCHNDGVISVNFDGEYLASGSIDKTAKIFNFKTLQTFTLKGHGDWVNQVRVDSKSRTVLTASDDCLVRLWDLDSKSCVRTFEGHVGHVQQVLPLPADFEPDDDFVSNGIGSDYGDGASASGGSNTPSLPTHHQRHSQPSLHQFRLRDQTPPTSTAQPPSPLEGADLRAAYGPQFVDEPGRPLPARYILTGSLDSTLRLWDTATGRCIKTGFGHLEGIWGLAGDTLRVVTCANDAMVKVWEPRSAKCERTWTGHRGPVTCVALSDSRMASGSEDGEVRLYSFLDLGGLEEEFGTPS